MHAIKTCSHHAVLAPLELQVIPQAVQILKDLGFVGPKPQPKDQVGPPTGVPILDFCDLDQHG